MKPDDTWKRAMAFLLILCLIPCLAGCNTLKETVTGQLWDNDIALNHYEPATNANVRLFQAPNHADVLVQYDEEREKDGRIKRRAYLLLANEHRVEARKKPHFVRTDLAEEMEPIPVKNADSTNSNISTTVWAQLSPDGQRVTVYREGKITGEYPLPAYAAYKEIMAKRLLLTPATVVVDTSIVGGYAAMYVAYALGQSQTIFHIGK